MRTPPEALAAIPILQACFPSFQQAAPVKQASPGCKASAREVDPAVRAAPVALAVADWQEPVSTAESAAREGLVAAVRAVLMAELEALGVWVALEAWVAVAVALALAAPAALQVRAPQALAALVAVAALPDSAAVAALPALAVLAVPQVRSALAVSVASVEVAAAVQQ